MQKKLEIDNFLILLIPPSFIAGPFILELLLLILFFKFCISQKKITDYFIYFKNFFSLIFFSFNFYLIICLIIFQRFEDGILYSSLYFRYGLYIISLAYLFHKKRELIIYFFISITATIFALSFDATIQYFFDYNIFGIEKISRYRVSSFFGTELILGSFLVKISPIMLSFYYFFDKNYKNNLISKFTIIFLFFTNFFIIAISGGRTSFFMYLMLVVFLFLFLELNYKKKIIFALISTILIFSILSFNKSFKERLIDRTLYELSDKFESKNKDWSYKRSEYFKLDKLPFYIFTPEHTNYYITSLKIFNDNKLFGAGPKSFRKYCKDKRYLVNTWSCSTHPHNYYFQLLAETGFLGFIFLIISLILFFIYLYRIKKSVIYNNNEKNFLIILISSLIINLFPLMPTGNFFNNWNTILVLLPLSLILMFNYDRK